MGDRDDRGDDGGVVGIGGGPADEGQVDLQRVHRQPSQVGERGEAGPEAIDGQMDSEIPQRPPNLCAGCSHRATFYAIKKAVEGMETIFPTDIGCYTLGFLPPLSMGDFLICMGSSVSSSCGFSKATDKKVISYIGDSTFFHSGITGLVNAVFNNQKDITVLEAVVTGIVPGSPEKEVMKQMVAEGDPTNKIPK